MKGPYYSCLDYPETPRQENRPETDGLPYKQVNTNLFLAALVVIALGFAVAYVVAYLYPSARTCLLSGSLPLPSASAVCIYSPSGSS